MISPDNVLSRYLVPFC